MREERYFNSLMLVKIKRFINSQDYWGVGVLVGHSLIQLVSIFLPETK